MNAKEMRELDAWIARNLFEWDYSNFMWWKNHEIVAYNLPQFTISKADAMNVLEKCVEQSQLTMQKPGTHWQIWNRVNHHVTAETLPLAICLFAKKLFSE